MSSTRASASPDDRCRCRHARHWHRDDRWRCEFESHDEDGSTFCDCEWFIAEPIEATP